MIIDSLYLNEGINEFYTEKLDVAKNRTIIASIEIDKLQCKQRPRATIIGGYAHIYTPKETQKYERQIAEKWLRITKGATFKDSIIKIKILFLFKPNQEQTRLCDKLNIDYKDLDIKHKDKDVDNLAKAILDALNGIAYNDDNQVAQLTVEKQYMPRRIKTDNEIVLIEITELPYKMYSLERLNALSKIETIKSRIDKISQKNKITEQDIQKLEEYRKELDKAYKVANMEN